MGRHRAHALGFAEAIGAAPGRAVDLGSGGGVPGLLLAGYWPESHWLLVDAELRRATFLEQAVLELGWAERVRVQHARAELAGRDPECRGRFDAVCARAFASPAATAECGAPFLVVGGRLVVSDPPGGEGERWPETGLARLGLAHPTHLEAQGAHFSVLTQAQPCPDLYPRRPGTPARRPLF